jgi:cell division protein FtsB
LQFRYRGSRRESAVAQLSTLGRVHHAMKKPVKITIIVLVLLLELAWLFWPRLYIHGYVLDEPYRNAERKAALYANLREKTSETKAAYDAEIKLLDDHMLEKGLGFLAVILAIDTFGFYYFLKYAPTKTTA